MTLSWLPLGLYVHIPWCVQKCPYCDFNSHAQKGALPEIAYVDALLDDLVDDLAFFQESRPLDTVFIGGGTPSLLSPDALARLLTGISRLCRLADRAEITLEANPGTVEFGKFREFKAAGITRLSMGIQSFNDDHLRSLGRIHSGAEAQQAIVMAHRAGFENFNLDLMFGLPGQSERQALADLQTATAFAPTHLSYYQLTLEPNTYFHRFPPQLPADDALFNIQLAGQQCLAASGYRQYEISAYAADNRQCRHNLNYWQFGDYLGIGAGAHGKITRSLPGDIVRTVKHKHPEQYLNQSKTAGRQRVARAEIAIEFLMNHLRLRDGFTLDRYRQRTGLATESLQPGLNQCLQAGLLAECDGGYHCSEQGWHFLDSILEKFIG